VPLRAVARHAYGTRRGHGRAGSARRAGGAHRRDRDAVEATHVLWDKTGTLTKGLVRVEDVRTYGDVTSQQALEWAASLEQLSEHQSRARSP